MKIEKFNLFEAADIKKTKGLPKEYLDEIEKVAGQTHGTRGPSMEERMTAGRIMRDMFGAQMGNEAELTEIGKKIIIAEYGDILDGVKLDIKIVPPHDREKREMYNKIHSEESKLRDVTVQKDNEELNNEIHKRKILNNLLQGEAQNIQNMMFYEKDAIDKINPRLLNNYTEFFKINKKEDWKEGQNLRAAMEGNPDFANMVDTTYENDEEGNDVPVIKVRALDLPMLLHETVKGIYDLIMAHSIPDDINLASKIKKETRSIQNEQEDVKYGPYIAADIRNYIVGYISKNFPNKSELKNIREFVYSKLAVLKADVFIDLIEFIVLKDFNKADIIMEKYKIVEQAINDIEGEDEYEDSYSDGGNYLEKDDETGETGWMEKEDDEVQKFGKEKTYADMSQSELMKLIDTAIDNDDFETVKKIQPFIKR